MKNLYRVKTPNDGRMLFAADNCRVSQNGYLLIFNHIPGAETVETLFHAYPGHWEWVRKIGEVE